MATIPANNEKPCDCCRRYHRKLVQVDQFWMGQNCAQNYQAYKDQTFARQMASAGNAGYAAHLRNYWHGYEKQLARIQAMIGEPTEADPQTALDLLPDTDTEYRQSQAALFDDTACLPLFSGTAPRAHVKPFVEQDAPPRQLGLL